MRILFTSVGRRVELVQAFRNAALVLGVDLRIYGSDMSASAPSLKFCDCTFSSPAIRDESYIPFLLSFCKENSIDCLIPTIDTDLFKLAQSKMLFEEAGVKVLVASADKVALCRDKRLTTSYFHSLGLKAPDSYDDITSVMELIGEGLLSFPLFIKPKDGSSSINAYKADNAEDLHSFAQRIGEYIIQPYVSGVEYTVDIFCNYEGNPVHITPRRRLAVRSGEVLKTRIDMDERIIEEMKALIKDFRPSGAITVQLIRDERTGDDWYIEINPRFGGGAPLSMKAGADSAKTILEMLQGKEHVAQPITDGAVYSRYDQSICVNTNVLNMTVRGIIFDLDDTLYPEIEYVSSGFKAVAEHLGDVTLHKRLMEIFQRGGRPIDELLEEIGRTGEKLTCLECYRNHKPDIRLDVEVEKLLVDLKEQGIKLGIITDGRVEGQWNKILALGLDKFVDDIIVTDELGGIQFRKPCDIAFRIMQLRWNIPFCNLVYVGDNPFKDWQAPAQLGMSFIHMANPKGLYSTKHCHFGTFRTIESMNGLIEACKP